MRWFRVTIGVLITSSTLLFGGIPTAQATTATYFDVGSYNDYCTNGGTYCRTQADVRFPGYNYAAAVATGREPNVRKGHPSTAYLECDHQFTDSNGNHHYRYAFISTNNPNAIHGNAGVTGTGSETSASTQSIMAFTATGTNTKYAGTDTGWAFGEQTTDNRTDKFLTGQIGIRIRGAIDEFVHDPTGKLLSHATSQGEIACTAGGPHATDLRDAYSVSGDIAEGEMEGPESAPSP